MIQALFIHDLLPGRHSAVGAVLNKDTDSNSQGSKISCIWYLSRHYNPLIKQMLQYYYNNRGPKVTVTT